LNFLNFLNFLALTRRRLQDECKQTHRDVYTRFIPEIPAGTPAGLARLMEQCWKENQWERPSITTVVDFFNEFPETDWE
jgi:hypothetical protein